MREFRLHRQYLLVLIGCALFSGVLNSSFDCTGLIFAAVIGDSVGVTLTTTSLFWTIRALTNGLTATLVTTLYLKTNGRFFLFFLSIASGLCFIPMAFYRASYLWLFSAVALGICNAGQILLLVSTLNRWFSTGSDAMLGVCGAVGGIITACVSPLVSHVIDNFGWRTASVGLGIGVIVICTFCALVLIPVSPEKVHLQPLDVSISKKKRRTLEGLDADRLKLSKTGMTYLIILIVTLCGMSVYGLSTHMATYISSLGHPLSVAAMIYSIAAIVGIIDKAMIGLICEKYGAWKTSAAIYFIISAAAIFVLLSNSALSSLVMLEIALGLGFCVFSMLMPRMCRASFGDRYEVAFGRINMMVNLANTLFLFLLGTVLRLERGFTLAFKLIIALCLVALSIIGAVLLIKRIATD